MNQSVSFAKLPDESWGIRYATKGRHPSPGDTVQVSKRDGSVQSVTLGSVVYTDRGAFPGPAVYFRILRQPSDDLQASRERRYGKPDLRPAIRPSTSTGCAEERREQQARERQALIDAGLDAMRTDYRNTRAAAEALEAAGGDASILRAHLTELCSSAAEVRKAESVAAARQAVAEAQKAWDTRPDGEYFDGETEIQEAHYASLRDRIDESNRWLADALREG